LSLKENKIFMQIKYWCYPVIFEEYRKKSMKKDNNLTQICKKKFPYFSCSILTQNKGRSLFSIKLFIFIYG